MSLDVYLKCPCCNTELFEANITHNLTDMACHAGIYEYLWHPDRVIKKEEILAKDIVEFVIMGYNNLKDNPTKFKKYNPENGWGSYDGFLPWVKKYIEALEKYPNSIVRTWA